MKTTYINIMQQLVKLKIANITGYQPQVKNDENKEDDNKKNYNEPGRKKLRHSYQQCVAILITFDINNKTTFDNINNRWRKEIDAAHKYEEPRLILVGIDDNQLATKVNKEDVEVNSSLCNY